MVEVIIGRVGRPHGVRGELAVHPLTDEPARRFVVGSVLRADLKNTSRALTIESLRPHGDKVLVAFEEILDRTGAEELVGASLVTEVASDEDTGESDTWYDHQLVGLSARLLDGTLVGSIKRLDHGAAQDLLVLDVHGGERLVPFVSAIVPTVDVAGGFIVLDPPGGLLDDLDA